MTIEEIAHDDFDHALTKGFWRKILGHLRREDNELLPYEEVREKLPILGQHYAGVHEVPLDRIVGSIGRFRDFDRVFLPTQRRTRNRWESIDKAHLKDIILPPVDLIKIGDIYFVKDGNHRVSVANQRGQLYIDASVVEIDTPVQLTPNMRVDDITLRKAHAMFALRTNLEELRPEMTIEASSPEYYDRLLEHIDVHRWYLGEKHRREPDYEESVLSWYDTVYKPVCNLIHEHGLLEEFSSITSTDLYLWIIEYQGYLRHAYRFDGDASEIARSLAARQLLGSYPEPTVKKLVEMLNRTGWLETMILCEQRLEFLQRTGFQQTRPDSRIETTLPGQYEVLHDHIIAFWWNNWEQFDSGTTYENVSGNWYDQVYFPLIELVREQEIMKEFPERTETDLYLWIIKHQWRLREEFGTEISLNEAADDFVEDQTKPLVKKVVDSIKKVKRSD